jgi:pimeloyl-ACP methyl ester carboxylesterase
MAVLVVVILIAASIPARSIEARQNVVVPAFEPSECDFDIPSGQNVTCGFLTVPEDRGQPDGPTIRLHVAIFASRSANPAPDPVVYLDGGPGGKTLATISLSFNDRFDPFLEDRDFIVLDQRGIGYSEPALDCPELTDLAYDLIDEDLPLEEEAARTVEAFRVCHDRLTEEGANLSAYSSVENAADLNDLRQALGYDEWNLYGISYGTRLALTIMRDHPDGIRSVILDSSYPLEVSLYGTLAANTDRAFNALFDGCTADPACNEAYGDLSDKFYGLVDQLNAEPVTIPILQPFSGETYEMFTNGDSMIDFLFQSLYSTEVIPLLPKIIHDVAADDYSVFGRLMGAYLAEQEYISTGMMYSVQCNEEVGFEDPAALAHVTDDYPKLRGYFARNQLDQTVFTICELWSVDQADPVENQPVSSDIPTLVLAGEYDPITPPAWGQMVAANLSKSYFYEFPGVGHGASISGECPLNVTLAFLADPGSEPDASCINQMSGPAFALPVSTIELEPFTDEDAGYSSVLPVGWIEITMGAYAESMASTTAIMFQVIPGIDAETLFNMMKGGFQADGPIETVGTREANDFTWTLYNFSMQGSQIDLAVADDSDASYLIMVLSSPSDHAAYYSGLFLPAIDAFVPVE